MSSQANLGRLSAYGLNIAPFAAFGLICAFIASFAVLANDTYYFAQYGLTPSVGLLLIGLIAGLLPSPWGLGVVVSLLPLTVGIPSVLNGLLGVKSIAMPNPGLDLVAGLFLSAAMKRLASKMRSVTGQVSTKYACINFSPWPVGLVMVMITASVILAIARNIYMSATSTSFKGVLFNLMHFRPLDWRADYLPIGNWVAYALATGLIILAVSNLKAIDLEKRNSWIFRPLMIGLAISAIAGLIQAATGWGLPQAQLEFRKDAFGYAAIGLQPDLHAFAAHMLLGVVGLWGYFLSCKSRFERYCIAILFLLCSFGLIASKSRASLLIAIITLVIFGLVYFYRNSKKYFVVAFITFVVALCVLLMGSGSIPGLAWVGDLIAQMQSRRLDSLSDLGGMMGSRFEIWSAVANMFSAYPLMGVGEGEFYRLSSNISFARSEFLQLNHGENAHNYFLQVLAENGLVGIIVFAIAFLVPYHASEGKKILFPASIALLSLFLGNIFAHSFLVRENLLLGAVLLGLIYSYAMGVEENLQPPKLSIPKGGYLIGLIMVIALVSIASEIFHSFGKLPFKRGIDCDVKDLPISADHWTSGSWEQRFPSNSKGVEIVFAANRPNLKSQPLNAHFEVLSWEAGRGKVPVLIKEYRDLNSDETRVRLDLAPQYQNSSDIVTARMQLSNCYTPRNLGLNTDGRRLGVQVKSVIFY